MVKKGLQTVEVSFSGNGHWTMAWYAGVKQLPTDPDSVSHL